VLKKFVGIFVMAVVVMAGGGYFGAYAAVAVKLVGPAATANGGSKSSVAAPTRSAASVRSAVPVRAGTVIGTNKGAIATRGASQNTIGKYLSSSSSQLKPGSTIKIPGSSGTGSADLSNYVTQQQHDALEDRVEDLENLPPGQADLTDYYTSDEVDDLLDAKQDVLDSGNAGNCIKISSSGVIDFDDTCGGSGGGAQGPQGPQGPPGGAGSDGREVELRKGAGAGSVDWIQWKYATEDNNSWRDLVAVSQLKGADGSPVQLQVDNGWIQWKLDSDANWTDLAELSSIGGSTDISGKADKVASGDREGKVAGLDSVGNLTNTGIDSSSVVVMPTDTDLTGGDGTYVFAVEKNGSAVSTSPSYMKVY
jgi:hypothetical protein